MPSINSKTKTLFFVTSPRTPDRMIRDVELLTKNFAGRAWDKNRELQAEFMNLRDRELGVDPAGTPRKDPALSARDLINRAPKAYGFVDLDEIRLTEPGKAYVNGELRGETLLRQLLKYQLPSPFHRPQKEDPERFWVKPFLEVLRLINHFGTLTFDEVKIFGMQLTDYRKFSDAVEKIDRHRLEKAKNQGNYKRFIDSVLNREVRAIYAEELRRGQYQVRESREKSESNFLKTKKSNLRDYTDACFRYLKATGLVDYSQIGHSISIAKGREREVEFILENVDREPKDVDNAAAYKHQLFDASKPELLTDDRQEIIRQLADYSINETKDKSLVELKLELLLAKERNLERIVADEVRRIKNFESYDDILVTFDRIVNREFYDNPLMLEWNTWRAMTMLDGGEIEGNFLLDDAGKPRTTAAGGLADIICKYDDFDLMVEVTLQSGQKQYDNEGEPVARHLGRHRIASGRPAYCLFIAPTLNEATIAHFYLLHRLNVNHYGGRSVIVPLELRVFRKLVEDSKKVSYTPDSRHIEAIFKESQRLAEQELSETEWHAAIQEFALSWLERGERLLET